MEPQTECCGKITVKHVYEIAKLKRNCPIYDCWPIEKICGEVIRTAVGSGVQVVHRLDPDEYQQFIEQRKVVNEQQLAELEEKRQAKMLRTGAA